MDGIGPLTVTVVTSSIGRPQLRQCVESVKNQTYPCKHFVFVNGPQYHAQAKQTLNDYPDVTAFYLPEETRVIGDSPSMASVFTAAPFLTNADWVFYLNDDDFYDSNHVESIMSHVKANDLKWAYSLRKFVDTEGNFICEDNWNSLGHFPCLVSLDSFLVDNSCFAVSLKLARRYALAWTALPIVSDRCFLMALKSSGERYGSTGLYTSNYRLGTGTAECLPEAYLESDRHVRSQFPNGFPWAKPLLELGELPLEKGNP